MRWLCLVLLSTSVLATGSHRAFGVTVTATQLPYTTQAALGGGASAVNVDGVIVGRQSAGSGDPATGAVRWTRAQDGSWTPELLPDPPAAIVGSNSLRVADARGVNASGRVGGVHGDQPHAFLWDPQNGYLPLETTLPAGTSGTAGESAVEYVDDSGNGYGWVKIILPGGSTTSRAARWDGNTGAMQLLGTASDGFRHANAAASVGTDQWVAGWADGGYFGGGVPAIYSMQNASLTVLPFGANVSWGFGGLMDVNALGVAVGSYDNQAAVWTLTDTGTWSVVDLHDPARWSASGATAISDSGIVVGYGFVPNSNALEAVAWLPDGTVVDLLPLSGDDRARPFGVNDNGLVVGESSSIGQQGTPVYWELDPTSLENLSSGPLAWRTPGGGGATPEVPEPRIGLLAVTACCLLLVLGRRGAVRN